MDCEGRGMLESLGPSWSNLEEEEREGGREGGREREKERKRGREGERREWSEEM